jgi:hypothetical protein
MFKPILILQFSLSGNLLFIPFPPVFLPMRLNLFGSSFQGMMNCLHLHFFLPEFFYFPVHEIDECSAVEAGHFNIKPISSA